MRQIAFPQEGELGGGDHLIGGGLDVKRVNVVAKDGVIRLSFLR